MTLIGKVIVFGVFLVLIYVFIKIGVIAPESFVVGRMEINGFGNEKTEKQKSGRISPNKQANLGCHEDY